jgi:hypothetical protein
MLTEIINIENERESSHKVVEMLENYQEIICREVQKNRESLRRVQETLLRNMEIFNRQTVQNIKSAIIESNNIEAFNQLAEKLIMIQESMKEFNRMESQHESIFEKEEERSAKLVKIERILVEGKMKQEKSMIQLG